jgi:hypothetical protein
MATLQIAIVCPASLADTRWTVEVDGRFYGEYRSRAAALNDALDLARDASAEGSRVEVAVWSASRNVRDIEWRSGETGRPAGTGLHGE